MGQAIGAMDFATLRKLWSPAMIVSSPGNNVLTREQVFQAMRGDKLRKTQYRNTFERMVVSRDVAVEIGHEDMVMATGPMAGKSLRRRYTNVGRKPAAGS